MPLAPPAQCRLEEFVRELPAYPSVGLKENLLSPSNFQRSTRDARADALHHLQNIIERRHRCIARRRHRERTVRRTAVDRKLRVLAGQKSVNQSRRERISSANAIEDLEILAILRLKKSPVIVANRAPIVLRRRLCLAQRRRNNLERICLQHRL